MLAPCIFQCIIQKKIKIGFRLQVGFCWCVDSKITVCSMYSSYPNCRMANLHSNILRREQPCFEVLLVLVIVVNNSEGFLH